MAKYLAKRLAQSLIAILGITVVVFVILHLTGDPVELMVSPTTSREQMDILRQEMGFNDPLPQQYLRFLKGAVVGDSVPLIITTSLPCVWCWSVCLPLWSWPWPPWPLRWCWASRRV